jgi:hypothetical protein
MVSGIDVIINELNTILLSKRTACIPAEFGVNHSAPTSIPLRYIILRYEYTCICLLHPSCEDILLSSTLRPYKRASDRSSSLVKFCLLFYIYHVSLWCPIQISEVISGRSLVACLPLLLKSVSLVACLGAFPRCGLSPMGITRGGRNKLPRFWLHAHGRLWSCPAGRAITFRV